MERHNSWDIYFQQHKCPCYITNKQSQELLFCNTEFIKLFKLSDDIIGKKIYEVIPNEDTCLESQLPDWNNKNYYESEVLYKSLNQKFTLRASILDSKEENEIFWEIIPSEDENIQFEEAMTKCIEIYRQPTETIMLSLMKLLSNFYKSERAYVYKFDLTDNTINCVAQWCENPEDQVTPEIGTLLNSVFLMNWIESENNDGIVIADVTSDDFDPSTTVGKIVTTFQLKNLTLCIIEDVNTKVVGVIGLSNRKGIIQGFDPRLIKTVSRFVAQEVSKDSLFQAHNRDTLTGLYNRLGYAKRVDDIIMEKPQSMGVISVNINGLRYINENAGIAKGDEHIKASAQKLQQHFGFEFFRMSGDEFLGLAPNVSEDDFEDLALSLYALMRKEDNYDFSFGHTWASGVLDILKLSNEADMLMYINKQQYYSDSKRDFDSVTDTTLSDLMGYLADDEFVVYLQPQVLLSDGSLYGAEALIRRFDKKNNIMVAPVVFIPLYEQKSVIRHLDMFVLETVCKLQQEWISQGHRIPISVNFSRITLQEYGIVESIKDICDKYDVPHELLVIEVTERVGLIEDSVASNLVQQFKKYGFNISLDDFGCAYSNIVTLAQIEVDEVKIDKSLVDFILSNKKNLVLVKNILSMCNELEGISTLAEGIEDEEQGKLLQEIGCRIGQGYFYSRPISIEEFVEKYINVKKVGLL